MAARVCDRPGCDVSMAGRRRDALYCSDRCRAMAWKDTTGYGRQRPVRTATRARRKPEPRLSYKKAVEAVREVLSPAAGDRVVEALHGRLTPAARAAIDPKENQ